jgi:Holliday junction resolvasome RuvABC DNA-binding subunit
MPSLTEIEGIGPSLAAACVKNNFRTIAKIAAAKPIELSIVPGISAKSASQIIASAKSLLPQPRILTTKNKHRAVAPVKVGQKATAIQAPKKPSDKEKKMSVKDVKEKIKKLKKKIRNLKAEKKKILASESKKSKKKKARKSKKKK